MYVGGNIYNFKEKIQMFVKTLITALLLNFGFITSIPKIIMIAVNLLLFQHQLEPLSYSAFSDSPK